MSLRQSIAAVVRNSDVGWECDPDEFQFLKRSGHIFLVPDVAPEFRFNINALKALIGQGDIYVRLLEETHTFMGTPSPEPTEQKHEPATEPNSPSTSGRSSCPSLSSCASLPSSSSVVTPSPCIDLTSDSDHDSPVRKKKANNNDESDIIAIFPATPATTISTLMDFVGGEVHI